MQALSGSNCPIHVWRAFEPAKFLGLGFYARVFAGPRKSFITAEEATLMVRVEQSPFGFLGVRNKSSPGRYETGNADNKVGALEKNPL